MRRHAGTLLAALSLTLTACGQRGDLYLPTPTKTVVPAVAGAVTSPRAAAVRPAPQFVELPGTSIRYQLLGNGARTLVLLHELGTSLDTWDNVVDELATDNRVLRYDLRGFGLSGKIRGDMRMGDEVADLAGLLDALQIHGPVTLIGGDVGAGIALQFAAAHPDRAQAVLAISPATGAAPERRAPQTSADAASWAATLRMVTVTEWNDVWPRLQCPVWVVAPRSVASFQAIADRIPGGRGHFEALDTGQLTATESPALLSPLLRKFLSQTAH
jgi:3-oxoadipate enol-lactonase